MKIYYKEKDMYPATYNFRDEVDGTTGTDIEGILSFVTDDTNGSVVVVGEEDGHKKVVKISGDGDNGKITYCYFSDVGAQTSGTFEIWFKAIDHGQGILYFQLFNEIPTQVMAFYYDCSDNKVRGVYGNGAGGDTYFVAGNLASDTWAHVRLTFDCATNTYSMWLNGTNSFTDQNFRSDETAVTIEKINSYIYLGGGVNALEGYIDAVGLSWDADYAIGDNLRPDMHDPYNKIEITDIITYPVIMPRLDSYWMGNIVVRDFEGALFALWNNRDFNKILIEDNSDNILFRGFLTKKIFNATSMTLMIAGIGILLDWKHFGSQGTIDYILAEGLVDNPIEGTSILTLQTAASAPFTWDADYWITEGRNVGILIVDRTDVNTRDWDSSAITQNGGTVTAGNNASTQTFNDGDYYSVKSGWEATYDLVNIFPVMNDGVAIDDTDFLKSITIEYNFRVRIYAATFAYNWVEGYLEILKDTTWITIAKVETSSYYAGYASPWAIGVPIDVVGGNGNEYIINDTDTELQKYLNKTGATYTSLKGIRFRFKGFIYTDGYYNVDIDYINVVIGYLSDDISPIMEPITDSAPSTVTCGGVAAWDVMGVVDNDGFKIGQNIRVIAQDIASESGLNIEIRPLDADIFPFYTYLYPDGDDGAQGWVNSGVGDHYEDIDEVYDEWDDNSSRLTADDSHDGVVDQFTMTTESTASAIHEVIIYVRCYKSGNAFGGKIDIDIGNGWEGSQTTFFPDLAWGTNAVTFTIDPPANIMNLNGLKVKLTAPASILIDSYGRVSGICAKITYTADPLYDKFMARKFKGAFCMEPLQAVCKLIGAHWHEDYINNRIVIRRLVDFEDSTVDLSQADYEDTWEYTDECNQVKSFLVFGKSEDEIFAKAVDESVAGYSSKQLIDESITNVADAQEIADAELAKLKTKRPSIKLPLHVDNTLLQLGTTVGVTLARPTVAEDDYPIRMIERRKVGTTIKTIIYCGMGESPWNEELARIIRDNAQRSHKSLTDRLISP